MRCWLGRTFPVGTRSVLFGAHCWLLHPFFVALAWHLLYGFPRDPRLWVAFFVHDLGYFGRGDMDGDEGERHVELGARIMHLFDVRDGALWWRQDMPEVLRNWGSNSEMDLRFFWRDFALYHSRYYAKRDKRRHSPLCVADKLAVALEARWLYLLRVTLSGEIHEYMARAGGQDNSKYNGEPVVSRYLTRGVKKRTKSQWHSDMTQYLKLWVRQHRDGKEDTWTPETQASSPGE